LAGHSQRTVIVTAAVDRFHAKGYQGPASMTSLSPPVSPRGSCCNHFASKEGLAAIVLRQYSQTRRLEELSDPAVAPLQRLHRYFEFLRDEQVEHHFTRGGIFGNFGSDGRPQ